MLPKHHTLTEDLKQQIADTKAAYAELFLTFDDMMTIQKPNLEAEYQKEIGRYELERFSLTIEVRRLRRKCELIQAVRNRNMIPDENAIDGQLDDEFSKWKMACDEWLRKVADSRTHISGLMNAQDSATFRKLYRAIAKALHPDLNPNQSEQQMGLWHSARNAYDKRDMAGLQAIYDYVSTHSTLPIVNYDHLEALMRERQIWEEKVAVISKAIARLQGEPPFTFKTLLSNPELLEIKVSDLKGELLALKEQLMFWTRQIDKLK